jgi:hypothetical protein
MAFSARRGRGDELGDADVADVAAFDMEFDRLGFHAIYANLEVPTVPSRPQPRVSRNVFAGPRNFSAASSMVRRSVPTVPLWPLMD